MEEVTTYVVMETRFVRVDHTEILRHWHCCGEERFADVRGGAGWLGVH